jgi:hypothetical protein
VWPQGVAPRVAHLAIAGAKKKPAVQLDQEPTIMVRQSERRVLSFKPQPRLERRGQDGQHEPGRTHAGAGDQGRGSVCQSQRVSRRAYSAAVADELRRLDWAKRWIQLRGLRQSFRVKAGARATPGSVR